ncbi:uncharacterized protein LOC132394010 isoform X2 [Hypanus sabinus]|uniref:uncharacterized protein LOC132394010 isoform X2 n=1 Tax=Hypanus sabinus TaxID=79690 RepID=UPI0028C3A129|nr:uncharacterized protein LOC132394010 isoform X2 [Hypanus sabinus]
MGSNFSKDGCFQYPIMDKRKLDTLRNYLCNYNPPEGCGGCINILLFGLEAGGKSSTINTFLSALDPQGATITCVPTGNNPGSLTPELHRFNPDSDFANYPVMPENVIHGVAFIFDMNTIDCISEEQMNAFKELQTIVAQKYTYRVVIGTKFEVLGIQENDHKSIYEYKPLQDKFTKLSELTGMEKRSMFVVSNQWRGDQIEMIKCILALYILENMIRNIDKFLKVTK